MKPRTLSRGRGRWLAVSTAVVLSATVVWAWRAGVFWPGVTSAAGQGAAAPATAPVVREDLLATTPVAGTLGYSGSYTVTGQRGGTLTWLPQPGQVIAQGQALYRVDDGSPVVLLYGSVPDWRAMSPGTTGADVSQLNHDLAAMRDVTDSDVAAAGWDYYSPATASGVQRLEEHLGVLGPAGSLSLGQAVFEPQPIRVTQVSASLGGPAAGPLLQATSSVHVVMVALGVTQQSVVKPGDAVSVTLPNGATTPGVVSSVGTVAITSAAQQGQSPAATIPVTVTLSDPPAAGGLDQAPVTVYITTATARNALEVPVTALLARSPGGYVVEVAGPGSARRWVRVTPGIFDDNSGLVQVTGALTPGQRVVVASS
jgi:multidrug efflux pump subunit AcrA (membrane-fusion protein)